ncbi:unnamed protein product [Phytophthora fragariaefolia]|uniref:Unnamed protein product n=1 Tax=Phytophthora fragariaefolia TaxID=1490495 RepID=A0A9W7D3G8_9STRA|nr:unnamed protein product [Phytophthora fragariaefolia]
MAGQDWLAVAASNAVSASTARCITAKGSIEQQPRGGVRSVCIKMTVEVMSKLEEYLDEQADMTMAVMKEWLLRDTSADVTISSVHRALHGMLSHRARMMQICIIRLFLENDLVFGQSETTKRMR